MRTRPWLFWLLFLLIVILAAALRLRYVAENPGWFTDEATHLEVARQWRNGRMQYLAVGQSTLLFSRLPLFTSLLALLTRWFGLQMTVLRLLTGSLGVLSVIVLALVVGQMSGSRWLGLLAGAFLAVYPQAVIYSRFGFSYNLLPPLLWLGYLGLWRFCQPDDSVGDTGAFSTFPNSPAVQSFFQRKEKWLALAAFSLGLGMMSDLWMISQLPLFVLLVGRRRWRALLWSVPLLLLPFGLYALVMLLNAPQAFWFDLDFVLFRVTPSLKAQLQALAQNVTVLPSQDGWLALGFVGLWWLRPLPLRRFLLLCLGIPFLILGRTTPLYSLSAHYLIPFLPFVAVGLAVLVWEGAPRLARTAGLPPRWGIAAALLLLALPGATTVNLLWAQVNGRFQTAIDPFLQDGAEARAVAAFVNEQAPPGSFAVATPTVGWLLERPYADFQMSLAAVGQPTPHIPVDLPPARYVFDPDYHKAALVIIDNWWWTWGQFNVPDLTAMMAEVQTWPLLYETETIKVYGNTAVWSE